MASESEKKGATSKGPTGYNLFVADFAKGIARPSSPNASENADPAVQSASPSHSTTGSKAPSVARLRASPSTGEGVVSMRSLNRSAGIAWRALSKQDRLAYKRRADLLKPPTTEQPADT